MVENKTALENVHWADHSAQRVIEEFPNQKVYTVASGITPSGMVHIGNFREVITTELVRRALEHKGKKTKFIYSWDIYDAFRKVPKNVPQEWSKYLRMADSDVPDPWGCHESYAVHFMKPMEEDVKKLGFPVEFQYQDKLYKSGIYADNIKNLFENKKKPIEIINRHKDQNPLTDEWWLGYVYCEKCKKDTTKIKKYFGGYELEYECECGNKNKINFKETPIVGLLWRVDWPMRWNFYKVDFEPGGKDHSTPGGSYDTGKDIIKELYGRTAPVYTQYNFVRMKGQGGKISSSSGNGVTVADVLKVYTPEILMYLFTGTRPNAEFDISFDLDVIKIYEDFDKLERTYFGLEEEKNEKKLSTLKRTYELSMPGGVKIQKSMPEQYSFRHLTTVVQSNDFDFSKVKAYYNPKTKFDEERLKLRFDCVKNWLSIYAPEEMKFSINSEVKTKLSDLDKAIILDVVKLINKVKDSKELHNEFRDLIAKHNTNPGDFFKLMYGILISKEKGPKLADFMLENKDKVLKLLNSI